MSDFTEKEIKILDINPIEIEDKLVKLGAVKDFDTVQNIATYQFPSTRTRYLALINQLHEKKLMSLI